MVLRHEASVLRQAIAAAGLRPVPQGGRLAKLAGAGQLPAPGS